jgi:hypothetical protein
LVLPRPVNIETLEDSYFLPGPPPRHQRPSVAILRTCRDINEEGTPILYSKNQFLICLCMPSFFLPSSSHLLPTTPLATSLNSFVGISPSPGCSLANSLFLTGIRWSTLALLRSIGFTSSSMMTPAHDNALSLPRGSPSFVCNGDDILARFTESDFTYAPPGPDKFMTLSISNWVSMQVMRAELAACQKALQAMMASATGTALPASSPAT